MKPIGRKAGMAPEQVFTMSEILDVASNLFNANNYSIPGVFVLIPKMKILLVAKSSSQEDKDKFISNTCQLCSENKIKEIFVLFEAFCAKFKPEDLKSGEQPPHPSTFKDRIECLFVSKVTRKKVKGLPKTVELTNFLSEIIRKGDYSSLGQWEELTEAAPSIWEQCLNY